MWVLGSSLFINLTHHRNVLSKSLLMDESGFLEYCFSISAGIPYLPHLPYIVVQAKANFPLSLAQWALLSRLVLIISSISLVSFIFLFGVIRPIMSLPTISNNIPKSCIFFDGGFRFETGVSRCRASHNRMIPWNAESMVLSFSATKISST